VDQILIINYMESDTTATSAAITIPSSVTIETTTGSWNRTKQTHIHTQHNKIMNIKFIEPKSFFLFGIICIMIHEYSIQK
jgi:hypothetical protein